MCLSIRKQRYKWCESETNSHDPGCCLGYNLRAEILLNSSYRVFLSTPLTSSVLK